MSQFSKVEESAKIRRGESIERLGLTFFPIQMCHYEIFLSCKDALAVRLSTLPVKYAIKDYLNAVFLLELDSIKQDKKAGGILAKIFELLNLSLRIDKPIDSKFFSKNIVLRMSGEDIEIEKIKVAQEEKIVEISAIDFSTIIRPLIAKQNGIDLPNETENAEIVQSAEEVLEMKKSGTSLKVDIESLIASVAYNSGIRERDIDDWTILEFNNRKKAIERDKNYTLYAQAEMGGMVTFKKGNPYPSWCFDRIDESLGTMTLGELKQQHGEIDFK